MAAPPLRRPGSGPNQSAALHFLIALGHGPQMSPNRPAPARAAPAPVPTPAQPMRRFAKGTMKKKPRESVSLGTYAKGSGGRLTAAARRALPSSTFAGPDRSFPIPDKGHARSALGHINSAPPAARPKIRARADAMLRK